MLRVVKAKVKPRTIPLSKRAVQLLQDNMPIRKSANAILMMWKRLMKYLRDRRCTFSRLKARKYMQVIY